MNQAVITPDIEQRVRDRAYAIWESEGRPFGRHVEHWAVSLEATLAELTSPAVAPKPAKGKAASRKKPAPARRAAATEMAAAI